jgi:hypothetical protein
MVVGVIGSRRGSPNAAISVANCAAGPKANAVHAICVEGMGRTRAAHALSGKDQVRGEGAIGGLPPSANRYVGNGR